MKRTTRPYSKTPSRKVQKTAPKTVIYKQPSTNVRLVKRHSNFGNIAVNPITGAQGALVFTLSQVPGFAELTAMYDRYKVNAVEVTFYPKVNGIHTVGLADTPEPARLLTCIDYTDSAPPANADEVREYESCECTVIYEKHTRYVPYPKVVDSVSSTRSTYISTASPSERLYGLKFAVEPTGNTGPGIMNYNVEVVYYMSFKDLK